MERPLPDDFDDLDREEKVEVLKELIDEIDDPLKERMLEELLNSYT
jgi:hypothetical protein